MTLETLYRRMVFARNELEEAVRVNDADNLQDLRINYDMAMRAYNNQRDQAALKKLRQDLNADIDQATLSRLFFRKLIDADITIGGTLGRIRWVLGDLVIQALEK